MDEKTENLGILSVEWAYDFRKWGDLPLMSKLPLKLPTSKNLTPSFDPACRHLTFVELPMFHLSANRRQRFDAYFLLTWVSGVRPSESDNDVLDCQQKHLEKVFGLAEEEVPIAGFFRAAREPFEDRQERFATQPIVAFKGFCADLTCLGFQYDLNKKFYFKDIQLGIQGAHACLMPWHVFRWYGKRQGFRYFRVLIAGAKQHDYDKSVAEQIELLDEFSEEALVDLNGVFEHPKSTYLKLRGLIVATFDHVRDEVIWSIPNLTPE